jgi:hypothetical protein
MQENYTKYFQTAFTSNTLQGYGTLKSNFDQQRYINAHYKNYVSSEFHAVAQIDWVHTFYCTLHILTFSFPSQASVLVQVSVLPTRYYVQTDAVHFVCDPKNLR